MHWLASAPRLSTAAASARRSSGIRTAAVSPPVVIAAGFGSGSAMFNLVIEKYLIPTYGFQGAFLWSGLVQGVVITLVAQFLRHPDASFVPPQTAAATVPVKSRRNTETFNTREMLGKPHFYILYVMFVTVATGGLYLTANQKDIAVDWGFSAYVGVIVVLGPLANGASRIFWGWFSDRTGRENTMVISLPASVRLSGCRGHAGPVQSDLSSRSRWC